MERSFTPVAWIHHSNVYEVNVRQYTPEGSFKAFSRHLPRLRAMGAEILWFMPITPISVEKRLGTLGSYYACSDYTSVNPEFGSLDDFRALVQEAHSMGFRVIIDWVANHTGWDHTWTKTNPGFYKKNAAGMFYDNHGWEDVIDLNYYDQQMRRAMIEAMQFWVLECDIDGFRCDMGHLVPLDFWRQARMALDNVKPLFWLAETEDRLYMDVFDCCYAWEWMHRSEKLYRGELGLSSLRAALAAYEKDFPADSLQLYFTSNHDENSWNGTEYEKYGEAVKIMAVFCCTWNGVPLIYSGQELPNMKRLHFFEKDRIEWKDECQLQEFYSTLLHLRKEHPALAAGSMGKPVLVPTNVDQFVLAFVRRFAGKELLVILNFSPNHLFVQIPDGSVFGEFTDIFNGNIIELISGNSFEMRPWDYLVLNK